MTKFVETTYTRISDNVGRMCDEEIAQLAGYVLSHACRLDHAKVSAMIEAMDMPEHAASLKEFMPRVV